MGSISRTCKAAEFHTMDAAKRKVKRLVNNYARCPDAGEGEEQTLMALVTTEKMLKDAQAGHYAVGAFNVENLEFVMAVLAAAEETKSPVIMQTTPGTIKTAGLDYFYGMVKAAAERASVPVALHLDHGSYEGAKACIEAGFSSIMFDGSHYPIEENIAKTTELMGSSSAALLNALKKLAGLGDEVHMISREAIEPIQKVKIQHLGSQNPRLHSDEVLIALAISAATDPQADLALSQLDKLRGCDAHSSVILSAADSNVYQKLGLRMTCTPHYQSNKLYHK